MYQGPFDRRRSLKLDITDDELVLDVDSVRLLPHQPDLPEAVTVPVHSLAEVAAEKLRCIFHRMQCRDLFDHWFLFEDTDIGPCTVVEIFEQKAVHRNFNPSEFKATFRRISEV